MRPQETFLWHQNPDRLIKEVLKISVHIWGRCQNDRLKRKMWLTLLEMWLPLLSLHQLGDLVFTLLLKLVFLAVGPLSTKILVLLSLQSAKVTESCLRVHTNWARLDICSIENNFSLPQRLHGKSGSFWIPVAHPELLCTPPCMC
jgi:hypothetical protein